MFSKLPSPITWIGGKARLLPKLLPLLNPCPGEQIYVEPFGGSGVVLLNKPRHASETYNDTDGDLINLFRVLRDPDGVVHLWWELVNTPVSRQEFGEALETSRKQYSPESPVKRAARFVILCRQRFGGGQSGQANNDTDRCWGTARESAQSVNSSVSRWLTTLMALPLVHQRLATVVVDHQDAIRCIKQWDSSTTLFYCDPPYVGREDYYKTTGEETNQALHHGLAEALNNVAGRVVLSYYPCPLVDQYYPRRKWNRIRIQTYQTASGNRKRELGSKARKLEDSQRRTELILTNFEPESRNRL